MQRLQVNKIEESVSYSASVSGQPQVIGIPDHESVSIAKAKQYRLETCPSKLINGKRQKYKCIKFKTTEFGVFGTGIFLYFKLLKQLSCLFIIMFTLHLPLILTAYSSNYLEITSFKFEQLTLGNLGSMHIENITYNSTNNPILTIITNENNTLYKPDAGIVYGITDLIGIMLFFLFILRKKFTQKKIAQDIDDSVTTIADYSLKITGLPKQLYNREELQRFFEKKWGKIMDVAICFNNTNIINKYINKSKLVGEIESAKRRQQTSKFDKLKKKITKKIINLNKTKKKLSKYCVCAFIIFDNCEDMVKCVKDYPNTLLARLFMPKHLRFRGKYRIKVEKAPEPSEIIYDNMTYSDINVLIRRSITAILTFVTLGLSCGMVFIATYWKNNAATAVVEECIPIENPLYILEFNNTNLTDDALHCLCSQIKSFKELLTIDLCRSYIKEVGTTTALTFAAAIIVVVVNALFKVISRILVEFEKHTSVTKLEKQLVFKLFVGLFFNTALVILLVNANTINYFGFTIIHGNFNDFTPQWFDIVGNYITLTLIINAFNPHIMYVLTYPLVLLKLKTANKKCVTQRELNKVYEGERFILAERYAILINTVYCILFYSSGIPLLLFVGALTFVITYMCDKFTLLKRAKLPPKYNIEIAQFSLKMLKPCVYMHLCVAIWMYGRETILLSYPITTIRFVPFYIFNTWGNHLNDICMNYNTFPMFFVLMLMLTIDIANYILSAFKIKQFLILFFTKILEIICPCICKKIQNRRASVVHVQDDIDTFLNELRKGNQFESYLVSHQQLYYDAFLHGSGLYKQEPLYIKQNLLKQKHLGNQ